MGSRSQEEKGNSNEIRDGKFGVKRAVNGVRLEPQPSDDPNGRPLSQFSTFPDGLLTLLRPSELAYLQEDPDSGHIVFCIVHRRRPVCLQPRWLRDPRRTLWRDFDPDVQQPQRCNRWAGDRTVPLGVVVSQDRTNFCHFLGIAVQPGY